MALDELDFMRERATKEVASWKLSEGEKRQRLNITRARFKAATPEYVRRHSILIWPIVLITVATATVLYYIARTDKLTTIRQQQITAKPSTKAGTSAHAYASQPPKYDPIKDSYWRKVYTTPTECRQPRTALKDMECRSQEAFAREQFEHQWAEKLTTGWNPREQR